MYTVDKRQFSVAHKVPKSIACGMTAELKEAFQSQAEAVFGKGLLAAVNLYAYKYECSCRFSLIFPSAQDNPKDVEKVLGHVVRWAVLELKSRELSRQLKTEKYFMTQYKRRNKPKAA